VQGQGFDEVRLKPNKPTVALASTASLKSGTLSDAAGSSDPLRKVDKARPRWVLYHGTSSLRLESIRKEFRLTVWGRAGRTVGNKDTRRNRPGSYRAPTAPEFAPGMIVRFAKYPKGESGMFSPRTRDLHPLDPTARPSAPQGSKRHSLFLHHGQ
jgi:hypothetical protein